MCKFTPGEWQSYIVTMPTLENDWCSEIDIIDKNGRTLAKITQWAEQEANAHLIAQSPRMANLFKNLVDNGWSAGITMEAREIIAEIEAK